MSKERLVEFLRQQCREKRLSMRRLSINAGLSPATVHNIIQRPYQPTMFSLNRLADYLGVSREYLWQLAGLTEGTDYADAAIDDPRLRFCFAHVDKLPKAGRELLASIIEAVIVYVEADAGKVTGERREPPAT